MKFIKNSWIIESASKNTIKLKKKYYLLVTTMLLPSLALASDNGDMISTVLTNLTDFITSTVGSLLAIIAVVWTGFGMYKGTLEKEKALNRMIGIGIVLSGSWLYNMLTT